MTYLFGLRFERICSHSQTPIFEGRLESQDVVCDVFQHFSLSILKNKLARHIPDNNSTRSGFEGNHSCSFHMKAYNNIKKIVTTYWLEYTANSNNLWYRRKAVHVPTLKQVCLHLFEEQHWLNIRALHQQSTCTVPSSLH